MTKKIPILWVVTTLLVISILHQTSLANDKDEVDQYQQSPFSIVIDGGSTGSRLHIFEFIHDGGETDCVRRGSERVHSPLSDFGHNSGEDEVLNKTRIAQHLMPLFEYAASVVPSRHYATTPVRYAATAGMRLLSEAKQEAVYDAAYEGLLEQEGFVFLGMQRPDISTLGGDLEGYYGAVAANFLAGKVNAKLNMVNSTETDNERPLGALDMGGSSTQIVYLPECEQDCDDDDGLSNRLKEEDFFSTSYLSYGVDQLRERLWDTFVEESEESYIVNPCANPGYTLQWKGRTLVGSGDAQACVQQVQRLIAHPTQKVADLDGRVVGGIEHPILAGKFIAMSLFFFTLDSLRELTSDSPERDALNLSWPTPSIDELYQALDGLCSRDWHEDLRNDVGRHAFTREAVLPHRCFESVYMVTLLRDGYGFGSSSRDITFAFLVNDSEVEWSLGMALDMHAKQYEAALELQRSVEAANLTSKEEQCDPSEQPLVT